jgi:hypothetical protein
VGITTYAPDMWESRLPEPEEVEEEEEDMVADMEELGGETRGNNIRALERTLGKHTVSECTL